MRISDWSSDVCSSDLAIEQVSAVIVIIAGILGLIWAIGRDAGRLRGAKIVIDLPRQAPVLQLAYIFPARRDAEAAVIGIIRENRALKAQYVNNSIGRIDAEATACRRNPLACFDIGRSRSEEHTSELQSLMRTSYAVFCLKKKNIQKTI